MVRFFFPSRGKRTLSLMTLIQKKRRIQRCGGMGCRDIAQKMGGIAAAPTSGGRKETRF
jgi:hypothetical protein